MTLQRHKTWNQRGNNVVYVNVEIYNVEHRRINAVHFKVDLNNVRRLNNVAIFNLDIHNVEQRWNNVVNMTIWKKIKINLNSKTK